jgi:hypothetical protein
VLFLDGPVTNHYQMASLGCKDAPPGPGAGKGGVVM